MFSAGYKQSWEKGLCGGHSRWLLQLEATRRAPLNLLWLLNLILREELEEVQYQCDNGVESDGRPGRLEQTWIQEGLGEGGLASLPFQELLPLPFRPSAP